MSKNELFCYWREGIWYCFFCMMFQFFDSFFDDFLFLVVCDLSFIGEVFEIVEEYLGDFVDWFFRNVNGYYKFNLKIGYLNINFL